MGQVLRVQEREKKDFWKPERPNLLRAKHCRHCGNELFLGSRYCHLCGSGAAEDAQSREHEKKFAFPNDLDTPSLICGGVGIACVIAALLVGFVYTASTALDWQAVQMWRIEWLLGALVAFAAGVLLKRC